MEFRFLRQPIRFLRFRTFPDVIDDGGRKINKALAYADFKVYGRGFAGQSRYQTRVIDLGPDRPSDTIRLDSLSIEVFPYWFQHLWGEVGLTGNPGSQELAQVSPGEEFEFIYAISARFESTEHHGFDAVRVITPGPAKFLYVGTGDPAEEVIPDSVRIDAQGLTVYLPHAVVDDEDVRIRFRTAMYTVSTKIRGEVFSRAEPRCGRVS